MFIDGEPAGACQIRNGEGRGPQADIESFEFARVEDDCVLGHAIHAGVFAHIDTESME